MKLFYSYTSPRRVHAFTKVEMFGVTAADTGEESHELYSDMVRLQKDLYSKLGLHFQVRKRMWWWGKDGLRYFTGLFMYSINQWPAIS